jgi:hypothetical protein
MLHGWGIYTGLKKKVIEKNKIKKSSVICHRERERERERERWLRTSQGGESV